MNEVEFVATARTLVSGDVVLFDSTDAQPPVAVGIVLRFVDPAKPLLVYRSGGTTGIDFFQDTIYASTPPIVAARCAIYRAQRQPDVTAWIGHLEQMVAAPLAGETPLFDAYAAGLLSAQYREHVAQTEADTLAGPFAAQLDPDSDAGRWLSEHLHLLGSAAHYRIEPWLEFAIWEGHDVFTYT